MLRSLLRCCVAVTVLMFFAGCASTPDPTAGRFESRSVTVDGHASRYQVFVPADALRAAGSLPVVLFLHGSGERGRDGVKQTTAGLGPYLRAHAADFPALVVLPQVPDHEEWTGHNNRVALAALDAASAEFGADPSRQYLTGMSMGGYGSWNIALALPDRFAAIVPVCGAVLAPRLERGSLLVESVAAESDPYRAIAQRLKQTPVWMFHGALDDVVLPDDDRKLHAAFKAAGAADARYTEYPQGNHNAWDATYADPAMWQWLFAQHR
ncbi:prolyl oligopeptidase family serine peptidase [Stenotrophomonas tumulicola]|uniref:Prolyl oligopeptidase family serine peptidase n=1 Tax=Stenotrophomonas tumulicola TaxID=1685415 RepID=A0A7W3FLP4_9GAMM|nr:prolyl oligopeptidase family serine peptidase [Stenotrophomonas tumulicola]MBA8681873.1 prolyl oligopeptidase family serine peptidase [Stenotrophomonas tumulicola]